MKTRLITILALLILIISSGAVLRDHFISTDGQSTIREKESEEGCVFQTVFEGKDVDSDFYLPIPQKVSVATQEGMEWLVTAQQESGGFGAGAHSRQDLTDPQAVLADPATTSIVAMAILRGGSDLDNGPYSTQLVTATDYLLDCVESSSENAPNITDIVGTQIQTKLGVYIDVILTSQYFSNLLDELAKDDVRYTEVMEALEKCVRKIESHQDADGGITGSGWAGVLQSSFAANALESADVKGVKVNPKSLKMAREYQKSNYDVESGTIATEKAAGVMLYSVSSSSRASAKDARKAKRVMEEAAEEGHLPGDAEINQENLVKAGLTTDEAAEAVVSYQVYQSAKVRAQASDIISGFGNNGGEEFLSFLQTGEGLVINKDMEWQKWYEGTSDRLLQIQNNDGSWNGHHCITSPVFCTATALLILSINNDIDDLVAQGDVSSE